MPTFEFTSPEGKKYKVNGPEGSTKEQAFQILQTQLAGAQAAPVSGAAAIPGASPEQLAAAARSAPPKKADTSLVDKLIGAGETGLTVLTGGTGGTIGAVGGALGGLAGSIMEGDFGTQRGVERVAEAAQKGASDLTYAPRTQAGQEQVAAVGELASVLPPVVPLAPELGAAVRATGAGQVAAASARKAADATKTSVQRIRQAAPAIAERVERTIKRTEVKPSTRGSIGAAATPEELQRRAAAESLPVPIDLTKGQASRDQIQTQFERETAKMPEGAPLRERFAEQNQQIMQNFDAWVDQAGAEAPSMRAVGKIVDEAIVNKSRRDKAEINVAYRAAEKAGEMEDPIELRGVVEHLNDSAPDAATAPLLNVARQRAIQLGIAAEGEGGQLVPAPTSLKNAERYRQAVSRATDFEPTNVRQSAIIKGLLDSETEGLGGDLYKTARRKRELYARQYEDRAVVSSLLSTKRGSSDRRVALEDVFDHSILRGSLDDVRHMRRVLQTGGSEGQQAWRELQGATLNWMKDQATKSVATDVRGNPIVSAHQLNKAIRELDADGKLDFVFGKKGAEQLRDLNEISKLVQTAPPGAVNVSNTSSAILAALAEAGVTGSLTGLPVPVLALGKTLAARQKRVKLQRRIDEALAQKKAASTPNKP